MFIISVLDGNHYPGLNKTADEQLTIQKKKKRIIENLKKNEKGTTIGEDELEK